MFAIRDVAYKDEEDHSVEPPKDLKEHRPGRGTRCPAEKRGKGGGDRKKARLRLSHRHRRDAHPKGADHEETDEDEYEERASLGLEVPRFEESTSYGSDDYREKDYRGGHGPKEPEDRIGKIPDEPEAEGGEDPLDKKLDVDDYLEDQKTPEEEKVVHAETVLHYPPLAETIDGQGLPACAHAVKPVLSVTEENHTEEKIDSPCKNAQANDKDNGEYYVFQTH
jgi:hypothetical protein